MSRKLNKNTEKLAVAVISKRARALYVRICHGRWYDYSTKIPKAMQELIDVGLVRWDARAVVIAKGIVPHDFKTSLTETWAGKRRKIL